MTRILLYIFLLSMLFASCSRNAITGRNQINVYSEGEIQAMSAEQYKRFLATHIVVDSSSGDRDAITLRRVSERLVDAIRRYYKFLPDTAAIVNYKWEFKLIESNKAICWCLPGGKIAVYRGFLGVTQDDTCLAIALGHEITHDLAKHIHPRVSQPMAEQLGGLGLSVSDVNQPKDAQPAPNANTKVDPDTEGLLPFTRKQELEADKVGLQLAAMAGYNPEAALKFWKRAKMAYVNDKPIPWITAHPLDNKRLAAIPQEMSLAMPYFANPGH